MLILMAKAIIDQNLKGCRESTSFGCKYLVKKYGLDLDEFSPKSCKTKFYDAIKHY